jgi:rhodanese-related sulfurtransferase
MEKHWISAEDFANKYRKGELDQAQIIDVREQEEWDEIHLEKARLIPMNTILEHLDQLVPNQEMYLLCAHGVRSYYVMGNLLDLGWKQIINVEGGMAAVSYYLHQLEAKEADHDRD